MIARTIDSAFACSVLPGLMLERSIGTLVTRPFVSFRFTEADQVTEMEPITAGIAIAGGVAALANQLVDLYDHLSTTASEQKLLEQELAMRLRNEEALLHTARMQNLAAAGGAVVSSVPALLATMRQLRDSNLRKKHGEKRRWRWRG